MAPGGEVSLVGYIRVSSVGTRTDERFKSPELQREAMERWARGKYGAQGHRWIGWFTDLDRCGITLDRPELARAEKCAVSGGAAIVVYDISRWARSVPEGTAGIARLAARNVMVHSASESMDQSTASSWLRIAAASRATGGMCSVRGPKRSTKSVVRCPSFEACQTTIGLRGPRSLDRGPLYPGYHRPFRVHDVEVSDAGGPW